MSEVIGIWVLPDAALRLAHEAAATGEPVELILLHLYANSDETGVGEGDAPRVALRRGARPANVRKAEP